MRHHPTRCPSARHPRGGVIVKALVAVVLFGAIGLGLYLWAAPGSDQSKQDALDMVLAETRTFQVTVTATGELRAKNQTVLRSDLEKESNLIEIVEEGKRVAKGDVLVRLNADAIQSDLDDELLQMETARADVIAAESALQIQESENKSSLQKAELDVELASIDLSKWEQGDVVEKRLELDTKVQKGEREHERLRTKLERSQTLFDREFLSSDELEKDRIAFIEAEAELRTARVSKSVYEEYTYQQEFKKNTGALEEKRAELERVRRKNESELETKKSDLANKKRQFELRQDKAAKLKSQVEKSVIHAPTDGLVVYATSLEQFGWQNNNEPLAVGSVIHPNQEVIMLPDTTDMVATVKVQEALVGRVKPGLRAEVTIDAAQGRKFTGTVESIGIMAQSGGWRDPNVREYEVRIDLDLDDTETHGLKPSMRAEARLILLDVADVIAIPVQAVFSEGPNHFVYTNQGSRFLQVPVKVGRRSDAFAEITQGITTGQRVLIREPAAGQIIKAAFPEPSKDLQSQRPGAQAKAPRSSAAAAQPPAKPPQAKEPSAAAAAPTKPDEAKPATADASNEAQSDAAPISDTAKTDDAPATDDATETDDATQVAPTNTATTSGQAAKATDT